MKKKFIVFILALCAMMAAAHAQLKINSYGKMLLGPPYSTQDLNNVLAGSIFGPYSGGAGSKLAFGDFGRYENSGWNVFVGEYGTADCDQLWLHGKRGFYLTTGGGASTYYMAYCTGEWNVKPSVFYIEATVRATGFISSSDIRFKSNIAKIQTPLSKLLSLNGVSYDFSDKPKREKLEAFHKTMTEETLTIAADTKDTPLTEKEKKEAMEAAKNAPEKPEHKIGFVAQELQKVFPDLVKEDDMGFLGIDYTGLIPVIVEAMREQQNIIDAQSSKIKELESKLIKIEYPNDPVKPINTKQETGENAIPVDANNTFLYQNTPNPFTETTEIRYFLPENTINAKLYIFNVQGQNVKAIDLQGKGMGSVTIKGAELAPGTYTYMLYANGTELDVKRMILTK